MTSPNDNAQLTAAAVPLQLKDQEFEATPLSDRDHSELDRWCGIRIIQVARGACEDMLPAERDPILEAAVREAAGAAWMSERGRQVFNTFDGLARLAYQLVKRRHENVTYAYMRSLVTTRTEVDAINAVFSLLHPVVDKKEPDKNPTKGQQ